MKKSFLKTGSFFAVIIFLVVAMNSCDKGYTNASFGYNYIYIPQATVSGGLNLNYQVPTGLDSATYNYQIDTLNHKVNVFLGVMVSGEKADNGFTVDVSTDNDTTSQMIAGSVFSNAIALPDSSYTLPSAVTVPSGKHSGNFYLTINSDDLKGLSGKNAILTVMISNPTRYSLNTQYDKVVVVLNVNALHLP